MDPAEWRGFDFREGTGCMECGGTGYRGRTAIHELLDLTDTIREIILAKKPTSRDSQAGAKGGHELPARVGHRARPPRHHYTQRDQQGYIH